MRTFSNLDSDSKLRYAAIAAMVASLFYLCFIEPYLFSVWRRHKFLGEIKLNSEIERRDAYGVAEWAEGRIPLFVGDKVDGEFNEPATFRSAEGGAQIVSYPFRVHRTCENEVLFSPLMRRTHQISWVRRRPQHFLPPWEALIKEWERLQGEWTTFKATHPSRITASAVKAPKGKKKGLKRRPVP